jgi:hypothetical protein
MAWFGLIKEFKQSGDAWTCLVEYYDDANPSIRIPRSFTWPLRLDLTAARAEIVAKGSEVKNIATINATQIVGVLISIP